MKKLFTPLLLFIVLSASGQNASQFKDVPLSDVVNELSYINGNKYQKDALFVYGYARKYSSILY